jgi:putative PIN family toxin of toxin-antitoxin system
MRAVFDTNVLVAAFATEGLCATLLRRARKGEFQLLLCPGILQEFRGVLRDRFAAAPEEVREAVVLLREGSEAVMPGPVPVVGVSRDPSNDAVLACALAAQAEFLLTGDADLLASQTFQGIRIVRPREFEELFSD